MRRVVVIGYPDTELLDISCPAGVFDAATRCGAEPGYRVELVSLGGLPVRTSCGLTLAAGALERVGGRLDSVVVAGGPGHEAAAEDARLLVHLRRLAGLSRRVVSVCTGATLLAAAGLLDRRRATTHWMWAAELAAQYPAVTVDPASLFVSDGNVHTSAGVTSAIDLSLALVEQDHGSALARQVARSLVAYLQRPGNQAQVSMHLAAPPPGHRLIREVCEHITAHLDADLDAATLARIAGVSPRHLTRLFAAELGTTPARHVRAVRAEAAAHQLAATGLPLTTIARQCGLRTTETLRQAFADLFATTPSAYRRAARHG
ncbi:GlxA family transcriptional regulator [Streptomyces sp. NPDC021218]|uniref:GlxA family transcriptional regulator n=1 Tax=unclassified Streptomyces TaxID=2593676 RepID=UPI0036CED957